MSSVSVFVPCYDYAAYLRQAVESVLGQEGVDVEVLILDDCSPDDTPAVAADLAAEDGRVTVRRHAVNRGHIATYNEGLDWASGDYTVLLSADDVLVPGALARAAGLLDAHPEVGFVYGQALRFRSGAELPAARRGRGREGWEVVPGRDWIAQRCREARNCITSPEVVVRTSLQRRLGGYRPELPHTGDLEMWMRFAAHAPVGVLQADDQAYFRVHGRSMQRTRFDAFLDKLVQRRQAFATLFREHGDHIPDAARLQRMAERGLAADALWAITAAALRGRWSATPNAALLEFARSTAPHGFLPALAVSGAQRALRRRPHRDQVARSVPAEQTHPARVLQ
jgi:glycosyltransferase involved in cell wall biosynthesis